MASMLPVDGPLFLAGFGPLEDLADSSRYAFCAFAGAFGLDAQNEDVLGDPPDSPRLVAYRTCLRGILEVAGYDAAEAEHIAALALDIETALHAAKLTPVESAEPRNIYNPVSFEQMQELIPELDLILCFEELVYPLPDRLILTEPRDFPVLSEMLRERPLDDLKDYAALQVILEYSDILTTEFEEPTRALAEVLSGVAILPPREERALALLTRKLGHPVSKVYVENFCPEATRPRST